MPMAGTVKSAFDADAEARTGLNPAGRRELGLAQMADSLDALDFAKHQRRETERRQDAAWLGPEGWARTSPESAQHAQDLAFGDARVAHEAANQPTMLRMEREKTLSAGRDKSDAYWQPGNQSMLDDTSAAYRGSESVAVRRSGDRARRQCRGRGAHQCRRAYGGGGDHGDRAQRGPVESRDRLICCDPCSTGRM
jgi:hypothetical protein